MAAIPVDPREELERLERKHAENPEGRYFVPLADAYRRSGDLSGAIDLLRAGLARHPDYLSAHVVLGRCYADSGEPEAAEAEFRYILSLDPQNLIALRTLGDIALVDGRLREAERWYQDLLAVDPMNDDARSALRQLQEDEFAAARRQEWETGALEGGEVRPDGGARPELPVAERYGLDDGLGDMVDLKSDDDRGALFDDDADIVVTETIAELYTRQGFFDRAADIYRELIRRRGGDDALEARLRRVESLASGSFEGTDDLSGSSRDVRKPVEPDARATGDSSDAAEGVTPSTPDAGLAARPPADSLYPLIGPAGEFGSDDAERLDQGDEIEPQVPPAYDFAVSSEEGAGSGTGPDDLDDLLIDPYADPFGSVTRTGSADLSARSFGASDDRLAPNAPGKGGLGPDPFADSFAEGFPVLDEEAPLGGDVVPGAADPGVVESPTSDAPAAGGMAIGTFLRSVASWSRSGRHKEADSSSSGSAAAMTSVSAGYEWLDTGERAPDPEPAADPEEERSFEGPETSSSRDQKVDREDDPSPAAWTLADMEFDAALGHASTDIGQADAGSSPPVAAEPSGADDLQLVSGVDDLFPWEIPVPEPGSQEPPPVQPLDLDPGYPFDDAPRVEAPSVDETVHAERSHSEAVEPPRSDVTGPQGAPSSEPGAVDPDVAPDDAHDPIGGLSSLPAAGQDDDDLESFQAWLRSLKR